MREDAMLSLIGGPGLAQDVAGFSAPGRGNE